MDGIVGVRDVYVVVGVIRWEGPTVMAVFDDERAARKYVDDYQRREGAAGGPDYKPSFDDYQVLAVELNVAAFRYGDLAGNRREDLIEWQF
jgi:hypothetical protein